MTLREAARAEFEKASRDLYWRKGGYYRLRKLEAGHWSSLEALSLNDALHRVLAENEALEIVYPTVNHSRMKSGRHMKGQQTMPKQTSKASVKRLSTPQGVMADSIITKEWVDRDLVIESVEPTTTGFGAAFIAQGHAPNGKKSESILIGASVLVKTVQGYLDQNGAFPILVRVEKAPGKRYYVFAED